MKDNNIVLEDGFFIDRHQSPSQFLERRIATLYGVESLSMKALDLVKEEMCVEKGFKRNNGDHFYYHCVDVANTLISFEIKSEDTIAAALLHDIIEDVHGYEEVTIAKLFNPNVARLVRLVTKKSGVNYKDPDTINDYLAGIMTDKDASAIKTADRMHNMLTLLEKSFRGRYEKSLETEQFYLPFFKKCMLLFPRYENLFYAASAQIEPLIYHIQSMYKEIERLEHEIKG